MISVTGFTLPVCGLIHDCKLQITFIVYVNLPITVISVSDTSSPVVYCNGCNKRNVTCKKYLKIVLLVIYTFHIPLHQHVP